jgi:anti-sigma regulatory factor (Ser/Thr protein kinase)
VLTGISLTVPSDERMLETVQVFVESVGLAGGVASDELTSLSIAVMELVRNGMKHGNSMNPEKPLVIRADALPGRLSFQVEDTGCWQPDRDMGYRPGEGAELLDVRGRGILIARNLAKWVEFDLTPEGKTRATLIWPLT